MRIAVFGSTGLVGTYLCAEIARAGHEAIGAGTSAAGARLDASDAAAVEGFFASAKPGVAINAIKSGMSTDECESRKAEAWKSNVDAAGNISRAAAGHGCRMVHLSSDWVYEGREGEVYGEESPLYPQNFYAFTKAIAEERVLCHSPSALVLRTTGVFGMDPKGRDFFSRFHASAKRGEPFGCADDQFSQPIFAGELARAAIRLVVAGAHGTYNAVGNDYVSRHGLALLFCSAFGLDPRLAKPVHSSERKIRVPMHLRLNTGKISRIAPIAPLGRQVEELKRQVEK
ncbi:GDP-L-fucose synthase [uncultured archaeon]|nr:GDP-L-fucose synthase [uncultured archaeon]